MDAVDDTQQPAHGPVRAAGGLVVREERLLLVHRPRFDDWSLPKGKLKRGEHPLAGAVREVREETGVLGVPGVRLPTASYDVWSGDALVTKLVDYWVMTAAEISMFERSDEVDEVAWVSLPEALTRLTYPRDVRVARAYSELPALQAPVVLLRPLDEREAQRAPALAAILALLRPGRLISAETPASRLSLEPLAQAVGVPIEIDERFGDGVDPAVSATAVRGLALADQASVVCVAPGPDGLGMVAVLAQRAARSLSQEAGSLHRSAPGHALVLSFSGDTLVAVDPLVVG